MRGAACKRGEIGRRIQGPSLQDRPLGCSRCCRPTPESPATAHHIPPKAIGELCAMLTMDELMCNGEVRRK